MIPQLQLALAVLIYIVSFLLVAGIVLAAFLLPRFLRDAKKESEEFEEQKQRVEESIVRGASQFPRPRATVNYNGTINVVDTPTAERLARETARRMQKGGAP